MSVSKMLGFKAPKVPNPTMPQSPSMAGTGTDITPQLNYSSLISTSGAGLKRKPITAKRTILGGA